MRAVNLPVNVARIDEKNGVGAGGFGFAFVKKPQGARKDDGVKHVRPDGDYHVYSARFDKLTADVLLGGAGVGS